MKPIIMMLVFFAAILALIIYTLYSISRKEDERGEYIRRKAMANTFGVIFVYMIYSMVEMFIKGGLGAKSKAGWVNPLNFLIVFSILFLIELLWYRHQVK
ncbi:MAG TPA: hypothetical protein H9887_07110 [Candidatus Dorea intestinavium]|nr:hypothetical protein [Candidatus Dorea intestinavium]